MMTFIIKVKHFEVFKKTFVRRQDIFIQQPSSSPSGAEEKWLEEAGHTRRHGAQWLQFLVCSMLLSMICMDLL